jgi:hypothetical protein
MAQLKQVTHSLISKLLLTHLLKCAIDQIWILPYINPGTLIEINYSIEREQMDIFIEKERVIL